MKPRINMITLGVSDMERAKAFYEEGLGLPCMPFEGGAAFFMLNGSWLSLYPWDLLAEDAAVSGNGAGFRGITIAHVVSTKEEVVVRSSIKLFVLVESLLSRLKTCFGVVTQDTLPIPTDIFGKWRGIPISGPDQKMTKTHNPQGLEPTRHHG